MSFSISSNNEKILSGSLFRILTMADYLGINISLSIEGKLYHLSLNILQYKWDLIVTLKVECGFCTEWEITFEIIHSFFRNVSTIFTLKFLRHSKINEINNFLSLLHSFLIKKSFLYKNIVWFDISVTVS